MLEEPQNWQAHYGDRPTFVFTSRELPRPVGADLRFVRGLVADAVPAIVKSAGGKDTWGMGGGELAGRFLDAGALDEMAFFVAPVSLATGAPLFPGEQPQNE
ncbi:dihydrofolate reductase family protein [Streptomyces sp. NPDC051217]|uniref:dihydrofolate reductase family protein n=1 Tax=Streptomyces sp. NPDC051217 TaxID=3365644 RepID=UPI00378B3DB4